MSSPTRPYRGVSAEDRRTARRRQLMDGGLDLIGTRGCEQTTMTAVCAHVGLTERYFYESFASRDALLLAVVDEVADQARDAVLESLRVTEGDAFARAHAAIAVFAALLTDDPRKGRTAIVESSALPALRQRRQELFRTFAALVVTQAEALFEDSALSPPEDEVGALLLVGGFGELLTAWLQGETSASVADIVGVVTRWFAAGMHT
jgi:AcrR family transcriptional regulator